MKFPRRTFLHLAVGAAALPAVPVSSRAQSLIRLAVRIVVALPPAGLRTSSAPGCHGCRIASPAILH